MGIRYGDRQGAAPQRVRQTNRRSTRPSNASKQPIASHCIGLHRAADKKTVRSGQVIVSYRLILTTTITLRAARICRMYVHSGGSAEPTTSVTVGVCPSCPSLALHLDTHVMHVHIKPTTLPVAYDVLRVSHSVACRFALRRAAPRRVVLRHASCPVC